MKKQVRCLSCNSRLFDVNTDTNPNGVVTIKCRRCGSLSNIDIKTI